MQRIKFVRTVHGFVVCCSINTLAPFHAIASELYKEYIQGYCLRVHYFHAAEWVIPLYKHLQAFSITKWQSERVSMPDS